MSARIAWKQVAKRLAEEAAFQQQGASASMEDLRESADEFMVEAVQWWWHEVRAEEEGGDG